MTDELDSSILPVFPLTGSLLLPGTFLPLNIFEPRYRNMIADVMAGERQLGMIQPRQPGPDNWGPVGGDEAPELYAVGCLGRLERCEPQADGRYLIVLKGVSRFRVERELPSVRGYRRVLARYGPFVADLAEPGAHLDPLRLLAAVDDLQRRSRLEFDFEVLRALPGVTLLNALCAALPLSAVEKQALLEAQTVERREEMLLTLLGMGLGEVPPERRYAPPTIH